VGEAGRRVLIVDGAALAGTGERLGLLSVQALSPCQPASLLR
jgi:hypothetical protein